MENDYLKRITVLYIEDDDNIRDVFSTLLGIYVKKVYPVSNGAQGLKVFKEKKPDIVISDIKMPLMDGITVAEKIKQISPETPVILITAFSDIDYMKRALDVGVEGFITKPVDKKILLKKLNFLAEAVVTKREIEKYYKLLQLILDENSEPIALVEKKEIVLFNRSFEKVFGKVTNIDEIFTRDVSLEECKGLSEYLEKDVVCVESKDFTSFYEVETKTVGEYTLYYFKDITDYRNDTFIDELTGVYNRKYLKIALSKLYDSKICIVLCDIDDFKEINDRYGHQKGDEILRRIGSIMKENLRTSDVIIRYGGEEFLILLQNVENLDIAYHIAENLRKKINSVRVGEKPVTCSFGVGCLPVKNFKDFEFLFEQTDKALYRAKFTGKNKTLKMHML